MTTKRVKMKNTETGRHPEFFKGTGQFQCLMGHEYDVPKDLADPWIAAGIATPVRVKKTTTAKGATDGN